MAARTEPTRLEGTLHFRTPERIRSRDGNFRVSVVLMLFLIALEAFSITFEDGSSRASSIANIVWFSLMLVGLTGEVLYAGIHPGTSDGLASLGRRLRFVSSLLLLTTLPLYCSAWGIRYSEGRGGGIVGLCAGAVILLVIAIYLLLRYRSLGSEYGGS